MSSILLMGSSLISSAPKSTFSFNNDLSSIIFSEFTTSLKETKNLPPLICRYTENRRSIGSDGTRTNRTYSKPSISKSSVNAAVSLNVVTKAEQVCFVRVNF